MTATLPRNPLHWPEEARHLLAERVGMAVEHGRPLTASELVDTEAWAEELVRVVWRLQGGGAGC